jgi:hypothetical protein
LRIKVFNCLLKYTILIFLIIILAYGADKQKDPDLAKTPIFLVHGHGMYAKSWNSMISYLVKSGYPRKYLRAIQLRPNDGSNIFAAEKQIAHAIEDFLESINSFIKEKYPTLPVKTKVDLLSHSMGGLSTRWYAVKVRPDRVRMWISLAGSNHGTNVLCGHSGQGADDSCPAFAKNPKESLIQYELNGKPHLEDVDETPCGIGKDSLGVDSIYPDQLRRILYITIRTSPDKWIKPEESVILDGAGGFKISIPNEIQAREQPEGNFIMMNHVSHDEMLVDQSTKVLVRTILSSVDKNMMNSRKLLINNSST